MALMARPPVYNEQVIASHARLDGTVLDLALPRRQGSVVLGITVLVAKVHQRPVALFALLALCVFLEANNQLCAKMGSFRWIQDKAVAWIALKVIIAAPL
jgi:hypothetical protein